MIHNIYSIAHYQNQQATPAEQSPDFQAIMQNEKEKLKIIST